jgi:glycosyltransferase involved in cell wall biosynthesis
VLVLSSRYEGMPMVLLEALALGKPVISTDCPTGPREILDGGRYGLLTPIGDIGEMAGALDRLLSDSALREGFAHDALERALHYGLEASNRRLAECVTRIMEARG